MALLEVGPVELRRRVRSGADLEHDRDEVEPLDRGAHGHTLSGHLSQSGADEDAEPLVGRADHRPLAQRHPKGLSAARGVRPWIRADSATAGPW